MSVTLDVDDEPTPGLAADGRPDPAYAAALGLLPAPAGRRSAAFALDAAVWVVLALPGVIGTVLLLAAVAEAGDAVGAVASGAVALPLVLIAVSQVLLVAFGLTQLVLHGRTGRTLGKAAFGIRSVGVAGFGPAGFWRITLRALVLWAAQVLLPFVGPAVLFASSGWDPEAARAQLARSDRRMLRARRAGRPRPVRRTAAPARAAGGGAPAGRRQSCAAVARQRPCSGRAHLHPGGEVEFRRGRVRARGVAAARARRSRAAGAIGTRPVIAVGRRCVRAPLRRRHRGRGGAERLLGRAPADVAGRTTAEVAGRSPAVLVPLSDDSMRISKTHAEFGVTDGRFWVADRASKNGTVVELPGGAERSLGAGERIDLPVGSAVRLGGRRFTVERSTQG